VSALAGLTMQQYAEVRKSAVDVLNLVLKRFPALNPALLPTFLSAIAGVPLPALEPLAIQSDAYDGGGVSPAFLDCLLQAGTKACTGGSGPKLPTTPAGLLH
jgi:hypothetical protein